MKVQCDRVATVVHDPSLNALSREKSPAASSQHPMITSTALSHSSSLPKNQIFYWEANIIECRLCKPVCRLLQGHLSPPVPPTLNLHGGNSHILDLQAFLVFIQWIGIELRGWEVPLMGSNVWIAKGELKPSLRHWRNITWWENSSHSVKTRVLIIKTCLTS